MYRASITNHTKYVYSISVRKLTCQILLDKLTVVLMLETTHVGLTGSHFTRWFFLVFVSYSYFWHVLQLSYIGYGTSLIHVTSLLYTKKRNSETTCN